MLQQRIVELLKGIVDDPVRREPRRGASNRRNNLYVASLSDRCASRFSCLLVVYESQTRPERMTPRVMTNTEDKASDPSWHAIVYSRRH
jgi:hypothetical protein